MGATLSKPDAADEIEASAREVYRSSSGKTVKFTDEDLTAESASLLNRSRSIGTTRISPDQRSRNTRSSTSTKGSNQQSNPQASGKLRRPSHLTGHEKVHSRSSKTLRRDLYDVGESPQKPPPSAQSKASRASQDARASRVLRSSDVSTVLAKQDERDARLAKRQRSNSGQPVRIPSPVDEPTPIKGGKRISRGAAAPVNSPPTSRKTAAKHSRNNQHRLQTLDTHLVEPSETSDKTLPDARGGSAVAQSAVSPELVASLSVKAADTSPALSRRRGRSGRRVRRAPSTEATKTNDDGTHNGIDDAVLSAIEDSRAATRHMSPSVVIDARKGERPGPARSAGDKEPISERSMPNARSSKSSPRDEDPKPAPHGTAANEDLDNTAAANGADQDGANQDGNNHYGESNEDISGSEEDEGLYGQRAILNRIFVSLGDIGVQRQGGSKRKRRFSAETQTGADLSGACSKARAMYRQLQTAGESHDDLASVKDALMELLAEIREKTHDLNPGDSEEGVEMLVQDVWALIFPNLTKLLREAIRYYDMSSSEKESIYVLAELVKIVLELGERAASWKTKPPSDLAIVKPVRNNVIAPLKRVGQAFEVEIRKRWRSEEEERQRRKHAKQLKKKQEQERLRREEDERLHEWGERRSAMYLARIQAEPDSRRYRHLRMPKARPATSDIDANGEPYERMVFFKSRSSVDPVPGGVGNTIDDDADWSEEQELALLEGLEEFSGLLSSLPLLRPFR